MLENIKIPESNELQIRELAGSALQNLSDASEAAWRGICESDPLADSMAALQEMADDAWASCAPALEAAGDAVVDGAKNGAYLAGRTALGAGSFVEGAVETGFVWAESAMGNREAAEAELDTQFCDELADRMGEALGVDDEIRELGDKAAGLGEAGAAAASAVGATLLIANPAVAPAVGAIATGAASMGVAGEVLHSEYEAEGELTDEALAKSGIAAVATAATIAVPGATARSANVAAAETAIAKEGAESAVGEMAARKGGSYAECRKVSLEGEEVHHMPAKSASNLEVNDGPAIRMDAADHRQTASCGNSIEAREYREIQRGLIEEGKFREAIQMDIDDIRMHFGDKYDDAIEEMLSYAAERGYI